MRIVGLPGTGAPPHLRETHMALIDVLPHGIVAQYIESDLIDFYRFGVYVLIVAQAVKETGHSGLYDERALLGEMG